MERKTAEKKLREAKELNPNYTFVIPRVVLAEIAFQSVWRTHILVKESAANLKTLSRYVRIEEIPSEPAMARRVLIELLKWCKSQDALVIKIPISKINWRRLISNAVQRKPPFSPYEPEQSKAKEKGFRDALILETVCDWYHMHSNQPLHFITGDKLLASATKERLKNADNVHVHKDFDELLSIYKIAKKQNVDVSPSIAHVDMFAFLSGNALVTDYLGEAATHFGGPDTFDTAYSNLGIEMLIRDQVTSLGYQGYTEIGMVNLLNISDYPNTPHFHPQEEVFWAGSTNYLYEDESGASHWSTEVTLRTLMSATVNEYPPLSFSYYASHRFSVYWSCNVSLERRFMNDSLDLLQHEETTNENANF